MHAWRKGKLLTPHRQMHLRQSQAWPKSQARVPLLPEAQLPASPPRENYSTRKTGRGGVMNRIGLPTSKQMKQKNSNRFYSLASPCIYCARAPPPPALSLLSEVSENKFLFSPSVCPFVLGRCYTGFTRVPSASLPSRSRKDVMACLAVAGGETRWALHRKKVKHLGPGPAMSCRGIMND